MMRIARESGSYDDERAAKNKRNQHSRRIKQRIKTYYKEKFRNNLKRFKTLKELDDEQARGPTTIIKDGEEISSPKRIAEEMSRGFVEKVQRIRNKINGNRYEAIRSYKNAIPRNENDFKLEIVSVEQVYNIINNMKTSNSCGNDELTSRIIKQMPSYVATATCHLFNSIVRLAKFPEALKTARLTPILKPGKTSTNIESYRPISNLNIVEKVIEEVIRSQLEKFLTKTKVITPNHHGGRKNHSTATAKSAMDMDINNFRDKNLAIGVLTTDLSAAYDTVDTHLLLNKLEHIGVRGSELEILRTYLMDRNAYVEIQGYTSEVLSQPNCSVVQGSKLSTTLYTIYTLDITEVKKIMTNPEEFKRIVGKDKQQTTETNVRSTGYINDVTHVVAGINKEDLEIELHNLYSLLETLYKNNILQMNGTKTCFVVINSPHDNDHPERLSIRIDDKNIIKEDDCIKILGFFQNKRNSMDTQLNAIAAKTGMIMSKLRKAVPYMDNHS